ncbi:MAG: GGDEF domain-containing protein [Tatlockia sp.]|jgi:diguanylate cyclase (GGDEF)-like protein
MRGEELQKQVANTISHYKLKCFQLENEIDVLKSAIYQLSTLPNGIHLEVDKEKHALQTNLDENSNGQKIKKSVKSLVDAMSHLQGQEQDLKAQSLIKSNINYRIAQLTEHLYLSKPVSLKLATLKSLLSEQLTTHSLAKIVDSLTDVVLEAFNLEHYQFNDFLTTLRVYLIDFSRYIALSHKDNLEYVNSIEQLQSGFEKKIQRLKKEMEKAESLEILSETLNNGLDLIEQQLFSYCIKEKKRVRVFNETLRELKDKFTEAECGAEKMRNQLSSQPVNLNQDSLTALATRIAYDEYIQGAFHRWERGFGDVSLALANLDGLKEINDKYGLATGDAIVKKVAEIFKSSIRAVDFVARFEKTTFVFIFERTSIHAATKVVENLRIAIEEAEFLANNAPIPITLSFGLSAFKHGDTSTALLKRAEEALRQAENTGQNQLVTLY